MNIPFLNKEKNDRALTPFKYNALDEAGKKFSGVEMAASLGAAHLALIQRGLQPLDIKVRTSVLNFEITKKKVPRNEIMNFTRQLAVFMKAGVSIMEALEVIVEETQGKMLRKIIFDLIDSLRAGDTYATACAAHPEAFPNFYVGILESAELTGNLDQVLNQLAEYIDRDQVARTKVTSALIYPAVVACMSVVTVLVLKVQGLFCFAERETAARDADVDVDGWIHRSLVVRRSRFGDHHRRRLLRDASIR